MRLTRCPICHSRISLEALVQDEAGRELLALVARLDTETGAALVSYLGLFRPASRDLANERALRLAGETLALVLAADTARLAIALSETVEALRGKQPRRPLKNHNYLRRVLESVRQPGRRAADRPSVRAVTEPARFLKALPPRPKTKAPPEPEISEAQRRANLKRLAQLFGGLKNKGPAKRPPALTAKQEEALLEELRQYQAKIKQQERQE